MCFLVVTRIIRNDSCDTGYTTQSSASHGNIKTIIELKMNLTVILGNTVKNKGGGGVSFVRNCGAASVGGIKK